MRVCARASNEIERDSPQLKRELMLAHRGQDDSESDERNTGIFVIAVLERNVDVSANDEWKEVAVAEIRRRIHRLNEAGSCAIHRIVVGRQIGDPFNRSRE